MSGSINEQNNNTHGQEPYTILLFEDILETIFAKMTLKDLSRAARVCKIWQRTAKKEIRKRNYIQGLILPMVDESDSKNDDHDHDYDDKKNSYLQELHLSDMLLCMPKLLLLIHDGSHRRFYDAGQEFYLHYWKQMSRASTKVIVLEAVGVIQNNTEILGLTNSGLGIALPTSTSLKISYFCPSLYYDNHPEKMNRTTISQLLDEAMESLSIVEDEHNCFIFFESANSEPIDSYFTRNKSFTNEFFERLKTRCKSGTYSLLGGQISNITIGKKDWADWFVLKITGPAMRSWSIVIPEKFTKDTEMEELLRFKKCLKLRSHSIALAMIPSDKKERRQKKLEKTELFRVIFPNLTLFGIYEENYKFGVNSSNFDSNPELIHSYSTVYLIITFD